MCGCGWGKEQEQRHKPKESEEKCLLVTRNTKEGTNECDIRWEKGKSKTNQKEEKDKKGRQISVRSKITATEQSRNQHHKKQEKKEKNRRKQKEENKEKRERREGKRESRQSSSDGCENGSKWTKPRTDRIVTANPSVGLFESSTGSGDWLKKLDNLPKLKTPMKDVAKVLEFQFSFKILMKAEGLQEGVQKKYLLQAVSGTMKSDFV